jgi:uncharacterized protein
MTWWLIFITGLTVGGFTCMAVQGGLLASVIAIREEDGKKTSKISSVAAFLLFKLIAYVLLGFGLGAFGEALAISSNFQLIIQILAGVYMVAIALNMLNVHPIFRYAVIQPPRFLTRMIRVQSKNRELFAPAFLGAMTIFIPCGTTLAIEALAISSGSPFGGAAIMGAFILGTTPLFFLLGYLTSILSQKRRELFFKVAAIIVIYLGLNTINTALVASGSSANFQNLVNNFPIQVSLGSASTPDSSTASVENGYQKVDITIDQGGYIPNSIQVKKGIPVKLTVTAKEVYTCALAFRIPSLGISKNLRPNTSETFEFTPSGAGRIPFSCSMGMYRGVIEVI